MGCRRHHDILALTRSVDTTLLTAPRLDSCVWRQATLTDFIPADQATPTLCEHPLDALDDVALQLFFILEPFALHHTLSVW